MSGWKFRKGQRVKLKSNIADKDFYGIILDTDGIGFYVIEWHSEERDSWTMRAYPEAVLVSCGITMEDILIHNVICDNIHLVEGYHERT